MSQYLFEILRSPGNTLADLEVNASAHWGVFSGLFGLANNELYRVTAFDGSEPSADAHAISREIWTPTARPQTDAPCTRSGLYVFRRFHVREADVEEVVALSAEAWRTFEHGDDYAAEPQGLFCPPANADGIVRMMLVTWYDGFASWETSRTPAPEARENFRKRHALTLTSYAVATRLLGT